MTLSQRLREYIAACFTGLWLQSHEHEDALREIAQLCRQENWRLATWSIDEGLNLTNQPGTAEAGGNDPLTAIRSLSALASADSSAVLVLVNFHRFLNSAEIVQALVSQITAGKQNRTFVVILSPVVQIPTELEKLITVIEHDLPDREQLAEIARGIATDEGELPTGDGMERVLDAAAGLTRFEAENAFSLSLMRERQVKPQSIWELKAQMLKKSGLLELHRGGETFDDLGGLANLKEFCRRALAPGKSVRARGVLLLGVPGTGKSAFAKALGTETGRPTLLLDIGALMGSLVGQTEQRIREALRIADAMSPCVLFVDELEKALSGVGNNGDSGVSTRLFGTLLTWMSDRTSDVFVVATANDISGLPPEFTRAERLDAVFFLDLPGTAERRAIWEIYLRQFELPQQPKPIDADWTPAAIRACCRLSALLGVPLVDAAQNVVPVARTAAEAVERLRTWAASRCLAADQPGIYRRTTAAPAKPGRKVSRDPSQN
jgi:hypothetical protein